MLGSLTIGLGYRRGVGRVQETNIYLCLKQILVFLIDTHVLHHTIHVQNQYWDWCGQGHQDLAVNVAFLKTMFEIDCANGVNTTLKKHQRGFNLITSVRIQIL